MEELLKQRNILIEQLIKINYSEWISPDTILKAIELTDQLILKFIIDSYK